jgi:hypothetical protein
LRHLVVIYVKLLRTKPAQCEAVGIDEFVRLLTKLDIDPIWYCQLARFCPSKIKRFVLFIIEILCS